MTWTVREGHVLDVLASLQDGSAQCCVTSPPYWGLRDYGVPPQAWPEVTFSPMPGLPPLTIQADTVCLGLEPDPWAFVGHMVALFREVRRVLANDGALWLNLGDSYAATGKSGGGAQGQRWEACGADTQGPRGGKWSPPPDGLKPKDMVGIPWRVAFALQADGWYLRSDCIWAKSNPMPESVRDRPTKAHEYVFLLSKSERYFYDAEAVRESDCGRPSGNGFVREHRLSMGGRGREEQWEPGAGRNRRTVWSINTQPFPGAHFAVFPEALPEVCIKAGSRPGDTVLDPFNGAGTTGLVAAKLGRDYVGIELSPRYAAMARERIAAEVPPDAQAMIDKGLVGQVGLPLDAA